MRPLGLIVALGMLVAFAGESRPASSTFPGKNGKLVFARFGDRGPELFVMGSTGRHQVRLFAPGREGTEPAWSPDGRRIVFSSFSAEGTSAIHVASVASGRTRTLIRAPRPEYVANATWSPDGMWILFERGQEEPYAPELYLVRPDGRDLRRLAAGSQPSWSRDGRIAFMLRKVQGADAELYVMSSNGSGKRRVATKATNPNWSPDGKRIAFVRLIGQQLDIYTIRADGSRQRRLTHVAAHDLNPEWSPDGRKIAFESRRNGRAEIYVMSADGSGETRLTRNEVEDTEPAWQPLRRGG